MRVFRGLLILPILLPAIGSAAESKTERDLRIKLAAAEADRQAAEKDKADLSAALSKLRDGTAKVAENGRISNGKAELGRLDAARAANAAEITAEVNATIARRANEVAATVDLSTSSAAAAAVLTLGGPQVRRFTTREREEYQEEHLSSRGMI